VKNLLREANLEAGSHKGQVMIVYDCKVDKEKRNAYSFSKVIKNKYINIEYNKICSKYLKGQIDKYYPKLEGKKIHTEIQWILEDNINYIRSDRIYILYSWYIPCAGNKNSEASCAEELVQFAKDNNITIIIGYKESHGDTNKNKSLEILKKGKIQVICLNDPNNIQI